MKKLYKKGKVHPTPHLISDHLSFLPAAIFTLTLSLSPDDREVLAYLLSCSSNNYANINKTKNHGNTTTNSSRGCYSNAPSFNCSCFRCYMSFWGRWDASPNRQLIHEIIEAFEDGLAHPIKKENGKKERRRKGNRNRYDKGFVGSVELMSPVKSELSLAKDEFGVADSVVGGEEEAEEEEELEEGSIRRFVSFVGEKIWGGWN